MKKWLAVTVVIIAILVASAYVFFPKEVTSSHVDVFNCNINNIDLYLLDENKWEKWWPGTVKRDSITGKNKFEYGGYEYTIPEIKYNALVVQTLSNDLTVDGTIFFIATSTDKVRAEWKYSLTTTSNPVYKIHLYWETKKINDNISKIMNSMKNFVDKKENVYGIPIAQLMVKDTVLVTTNFSTRDYPSTEIIYSFIDSIKGYISANKVRETNFPMVHIRQDSGFYKSQLAIPVSKAIPGSSRYLIKRMVPGKILVSQVTGGIYTVQEALRQLGTYMTDYHLSAPAIPFESLVTNRREEPDTSKWVTKIYFPVM